MKGMQGLKYLLFECLFDLPTNLVATKVIHSLKKAHPERSIVIVTFFPEVWLHNPDVYRVYKAGTVSYFFEDYIKDKDTLIYKHNPILTTAYAQNLKPLEEIWCDLYGIPSITNTPKLFFTWREKEAVQKLTRSDKPILFIESTIIPTSFGRNFNSTNNISSWSDKIPPILLQAVVLEMQKNGYHVVDISNSETTFPNTDKLNLDLRLRLCAIQYCDTSLSINSFSSHMAKYFNRQAVVLWISDSIKVWGYSDQKNIKVEAEAHTIDFIERHKKELSFAPSPNFPFNLNTAFDVKHICDELASVARYNKKNNLL